MKIIVISDSHGNSLAIDKIFATEKFDYLFFLGDGINDLGDYIYLDNVFAVSGNCDFFSDVPNERIFSINNINFFITHGNRYFVKKNLSFLKEKAISEGVDYVFYGHTHSQMIEEYSGIKFINPGSFSKNLKKESRGLIVTIEKDKFEVSDLII